MYSHQNNKISGISALPTILIVSAIIIEIAVTGVVLASVLSNTRFSDRLATEALGVARAGAQDVMLQVIREKGCPSSLSDLTVGSRTAERTCYDNTVGGITIRSTGSAFTRKKKIEVVLRVDPTTGKVSLKSFKEVPFYVMPF